MGKGPGDAWGHGFVVTQISWTGSDVKMILSSPKTKSKKTSKSPPGLVFSLVNVELSGDWWSDMTEDEQQPDIIMPLLMHKNQHRRPA